MFRGIFHIKNPNVLFSSVILLFHFSRYVFLLGNLHSICRLTSHVLFSLLAFRPFHQWIIRAKREEKLKLPLLLVIISNKRFSEGVKIMTKITLLDYSWI